MESALAIQPQEHAAVSLIREAMERNVSPEHLGKLLEVRQAWEADEARKAFNVAVSEFQRQAPIVAKLDTAHDKKYARRDRIWREIRPLLTELGLSVTFQICELREQICHIEGQLRHRDGHGERIVQDVPLPEIIRGQNLAQQMGSASEYAKRYATCAALGIVTGDDDDGNKAGAQFVTIEQAKAIMLKLDACRGLNEFSEPKFWGWVGCGATTAKEIPAVRFNDVMGFFDRKLKGGA